MTDPRTEAAFAILRANQRLTRRSGSFLGQLIADATPMSEAQLSWFRLLAERAGVDVEGIAA